MQQFFRNYRVLSNLGWCAVGTLVNGLIFLNFFHQQSKNLGNLLLFLTGQRTAETLDPFVAHRYAIGDQLPARIGQINAPHPPVGRIIQALHSETPRTTCTR